jgi:hypothetical protein
MPPLSPLALGCAAESTIKAASFAADDDPLLSAFGAVALRTPAVPAAAQQQHHHHQQQQHQQQQQRRPPLAGPSSPRDPSQTHPHPSKASSTHSASQPYADSPSEWGLGPSGPRRPDTTAQRVAGASRDDPSGAGADAPAVPRPPGPAPGSGPAGARAAAWRGGFPSGALSLAASTDGGLPRCASEGPPASPSRLSPAFGTGSGPPPLARRSAPFGPAAALRGASRALCDEVASGGAGRAASSDGEGGGSSSGGGAAPRRRSVPSGAARRRQLLARRCSWGTDEAR